MDTVYVFGVYTVLRFLYHSLYIIHTPLDIGRRTTWQIVCAVRLGTVKKKTDLLFSRPRDVYADRFDSVVIFVFETPSKRTHGLLYVYYVCMMCVKGNISRPRSGTSSPNILAVFAAANKNKNFLFSFLRHKFISHGIFHFATRPFPAFTPPVTYNGTRTIRNILMEIRYGFMDGHPVRNYTITF